jgi:hypothetical protein
MWKVAPFDTTALPWPGSQTVCVEYDEELEDEESCDEPLEGEDEESCGQLSGSSCHGGESDVEARSPCHGGAIDVESVGGSLMNDRA